jgi:hypothetical protein
MKMKIILFALLLMPLMVSAAILQVASDGSQAYSHIQAAVNSAADQDTILVHPGIYYENIEIVSRHLTIGSLEMITGDSTYIANTVVNGNQTGGCFYVSGNSNIWIQGLYLTNGIGFIALTDNLRYGGAIFVSESSFSIVNCQIMYNTAKGGSAIFSYYSPGYLAGTVVAYNHAVFSSAISIVGNSEPFIFDPVNRCSVFWNYSALNNDIYIGMNEEMEWQIYLDRFTVPYSADYIVEFVKVITTSSNSPAPYILEYNSAVITPQYADFYVSPEGDDNNSGLSPDTPLKTIALALLKVKADSLHQQTIHLANGYYGQDQLFPLNLRSYVSIVGESEEGTIFNSPNVFCIIWDSEKEIAIRNITFEAITDNVYILENLISGISRSVNYEYMDKFSITLENLTFRNCRPSDYNRDYRLIDFTYPESLIMKNITIEDCMGTLAIYVGGGNLTAENIRIHHFYHPPIGVRGGRAMALTLNNPQFAGNDNIITNLQVTGCVTNTVDWDICTSIYISCADIPTTMENYFINATISDNYGTAYRGAGITMGTDARATFINSIISNNLRYNFRMDCEHLPSRLRFLNSLIGPETEPGDSFYNLSPDNLIEWYGTNLDTDPMFYAYTANLPYTLGPDSPCIDAGTTDWSIFTLPDWYMLPLTDLAGDDRIYGSQIDMGAYEWHGQTNITEDVIPVPSEILSLRIHPNPFLGRAEICLDLKKQSEIKLEIYNLKGQLVRTISSGSFSKGSHSFWWNGDDDNGKAVSSGIYFCRIQQDSRLVKAIKVTVIK